MRQAEENGKSKDIDTTAREFQTDRFTDMTNAICPSPFGRGIKSGTYVHAHLKFVFFSFQMLLKFTYS